MVHRAPDSRLLSHLIDHEKEYAKHLAALFPLARPALASLSAYAAAAADPAHALAVAGVVDVLANADDALQRYNHAVEAWRDQLVALKELEDDLTAILRDRDILVTRLIKASKSTREANRSSRLVPLTGLGSASLSSLPSTNSTATSSPTNTNAKLAQAQAELQACEAHLVAKEHELDARRISIARDGLGARCRALIDCGWVWGEMGRQGLTALQALSPPNGTVSKPLPNPMYVSDSSSLTPSQSASQTVARSVETSQEALSSNHTDEVTIPLPPAHAISELALPAAVPSPKPSPPPKATPSAVPAPARKGARRRRPPSQHITEASDEASDGPSSASASHHTAKPDPVRTPFPTEPDSDSSSESVHPIGPFQVVDNDPFEVIRKSMLSPSASALFVPAAPSSAVARASAPDVRSSVHVDTGPSKPALFGSPKRARRTSMAFLGSLRGLFRKSKERAPVVPDWDGSLTPRKSSGRWITRTDGRIKGRRSEDTDDEQQQQAQTNVVRRASRLRKGRPGVPVRGNGSTLEISSPRVDGWLTDEVSRGRGIPGLGRAQTRRKRRKMSVADLRGSDQGHTDGEVEHVVTKGRAPEPTPVIDIAPPRRASTFKDMSTNVPPKRSMTTTMTRGRTDTTRRSASFDAHAPSLSISSSSSMSSSPKRKPPPPVDPALEATASSTPSFQTPPTSPTPPKQRRPMANGRGKHVEHPSLMSVVADVTREAKSMDVPRAPGSVLSAAKDTPGEHVGHGRGHGHTRSASSPVVVPVKMPLRSALRNGNGSASNSRTPSPSKVGVVSRDSVSVSSYETGRESFGVPSPSSPPAPTLMIPPPPNEDPPETKTGTGTVRRKSVRVSLRPTFSPTPPAEEGPRAPWDDDAPREDVWADSSEEDEGYGRARRLLSRVGGQPR